MIRVRIKKTPKAKTGYQVQGALVNDVPAMGGADYNAYIGQPKLKESKYITAVPREEANLEAEGGETVYGDINGDGFPEHKIIKGPRHSNGGVPLSLPEDTFIFSDTRSMRIKDPELLTMFGKGGSNKSFTPAELAKQYDVQKYRKILEDPESDTIDKKTAELMIKKFVVKLGCLALAQESMKGFPQGIPAVAKPCMEARGITEEEILPNKEITVLNDQLKKQTEGEEGSDENMVEEAVGMNEGQPVAQPTEQPSPEDMMGMMYGGSRRRLKRAQEGVEQEAGGEDIVQEVQAALERGAQPSEVVMSLLQNQIQPEAIVQIFMQLGAEQEAVVNLIQGVMAQSQGGGQEQMMAQQAPAQEQPMSEEEMMMMQQQQQAAPMAMYGMSMGGYDMPFAREGMELSSWDTSPKKKKSYILDIADANIKGYRDEPWFNMGLSDDAFNANTGLRNYYDSFDADGNYMTPSSKKQNKMAFGGIPYAAYGMAMGSGRSQNYEGRTKRTNSTGPMFPLPKAPTGIEVKESDFATPEEFQTALKRAYIQSKKSGEEIYVIKADGSKVKQKVSATGHTEYSGSDLESGWNGNQVAAATFEAMKQTFTDDKAKEAFANKVRETLAYDAKDAGSPYRGKTGKYSQTYQEKFGKNAADLSNDEIVEKYLRMQERNLKITTLGGKKELAGVKGYGSWMYRDDNGDLRAMDSYDKNGDGKLNGDELGFRDVVKKVYPDLSATEIDDMRLKIKNAGLVSLEAASDQVGVPMKRAARSGKAASPYDEEAYIQQAGFIAADKLMKDLDANPDNYDEDTQLGLLGITSFAGFDPYGKQVGYSDEFGMGVTNISPIDRYYTNTTAGEVQAHHGLKFEDVIENGPGCQCEDSTKPNYGKLDESTGQCNPELCTTPSAQTCPCQKSDGTVLEMTVNPDGTCPPCEEDQNVDVPGQPAAWWLQDTIKTTGAFGDMMGVKKYMPWAPGVELGTPRPTFLDPTRELAANAEQANIQTQAMAQFAGPQALSARSSGVQGQAAKNAADVLSRYNNANVNIANEFELKANDIRNQESLLKQSTAQRLYDQNTIANQQFDNAKLAMRNNLRNYYTNAVTNRWKTDALNQMYPNYAVDPSVGGAMNFQPTAKTPTPTSGSGGFTNKQEAFQWCKDNGDSNPSACAQRMMSSSNKTASTGADAAALESMYPTSRKGGPVQKDNGYIYINSWLPFLM